MTTCLRRLGGVIILTVVFGTRVAGGQAQSAQTAPATSLEDLLDVEVESVVTAARHAQRPSEAPASVTVITATDIAQFGWRTLADVLVSVRGFNVTYDRNYSYVGVRAFGRPTDYNNRVLVLVDGHRTNDSIYDGAYIGTEFPIDLSLVDRIEVIRGPGSALYGTSAFLAVVNVISKRGANMAGRQVELEASSFNTYRFRASQGWSNDHGGEGVLSVSRHDSEGPHSLYFPEYASPDTNNGIATGLDGDTATRLYGAATFGGLRLQGVFGEREKHVPTASWDTAFGDSRFTTRDRRSWGSASYTKDVGPTGIDARVYYDHYRYTGDYPYDTAVSVDSAVADAIGGEASLRRRFGRHLLTVGIEPRFNLRQNQMNTDGESLLDDRRSSQEVGSYVQDEVALATRLTAILGARYDWWSLKGGTGRPRLGLVYRTEADTAIKALYGEAYRAPNLYEMYYYDANGLNLNNETLSPEVTRTTEFVFEQHLARRLRLSATAYFTRITGLIDPLLQDNAPVLYVNKESARSTGVEVEGETRSATGLLVRASLAIQRATDSASDTRLSNAPGQLGTLQVSLPVWRRQIVLASDSTFTSWRNTVYGERLPAYWLSHVTATYRPLASPVVVGASVYNVLDASYAHPVGVEFRQPAIQQNGRTGSIRVTVSF
ncbi:MAG: TonB-dependent receptor [Acidobacteria bacterium]|nr:TonB-dependent receptor [Acidobacteriota bacterium]